MNLVGLILRIPRSEQQFRVTEAQADGTALHLELVRVDPRGSCWRCGLTAIDCLNDDDGECCADCPHQAAVTA